MKRYIRCSRLSGSELTDYINKVKKNVEIDLEDLGLDSKQIRWYMYDNTLVLYVYYDGQDNFATIKIDIDDFAANPFYISYDADLIVNRVKKYMRDNNIKLSDSERDRYEYIRSKSVMDSDGFYTDYTMYYDPEEDVYLFIFGDNDLYDPTNTEPDMEADSEEAANEWFDSYNGFEEDDEDIESCESVMASEDDDMEMDATDVVLWMYAEFPYVEFIDERDRGDEVDLYFKMNEYYTQGDLEDRCKAENLNYRFRDGMLIIRAKEEDFEEEDYTSFYEDIDPIYIDADPITEKEDITSSFDPTEDFDAMNTIGDLNPGDVFINRNGVEVTIVEPSKDGRIQFCIGDECKIGSERSVKNFLYRNNYIKKTL